jgi:hypothetical protein
MTLKGQLMRKRLSKKLTKRLSFLFTLSFLLLLLLFLLFSIFVAGDDETGVRTVRAEVTEPSGALTISENASPGGFSSYGDQIIILKNPTFEEVREFILKDTTDRNKFVSGKYECRHFAADVVNNAEAAGLRAGFALLGYEDSQHAVVAFETIDRGPVFVEPQTDAVIDVSVGSQYQRREIKEIIIAW